MDATHGQTQLWTLIPRYMCPVADFVSVELRSADLDFVVLPAELLLHGLLPLREYAA